MKKMIIGIFILLIILVTACQSAKKEMPAAKTTSAEKPVEDAAVNSVEEGIGNADSVEDELNADALNDLDSGLSDIQNI